MTRHLLSLALLAGLALPASCAGKSPVNGARALERVKTQCAFGPRVVGTEAHAKTLEWIVAEATRLGGRVERQTFADSATGRAVTLTNVIAHFGPETGRRILFCAHFDSRPWCDRDPDPAFHDQPVPGANDGASGVAVLLELAERFKLSPPPVGVDLVFFDGEDLGTNDRPEEFCLGSRGYAERLPAPGSPGRPVAGFLLDMVGDRDLQVFHEKNSAERASNLTALVAEAARATGARSFRDEVKWSIIDDHVPLLDAGLPTVDVIDFDYPAWHTHRDTPDQVSAESLAEVARVVEWIAYRSVLARP
ncbi:MAG: M28 family peptidase [Candidatus Eisenbacteria bacterium]|uniref:M28 family peptidase n=1 Tax=Eiseniibacteriota bacterium TaxID=2212470 RepID=A0A933SD90_UNCEI|nr:M28 family peptidase [Candidatus Eisenbacteria bacterium]